MRPFLVLQLSLAVLALALWLHGPRYVAGKELTEYEKFHATKDTSSSADDASDKGNASDDDGSDSNNNDSDSDSDTGEGKGGGTEETQAPTKSPTVGATPTLSPTSATTKSGTSSPRTKAGRPNATAPPTLPEAQNATLPVNSIHCRVVGGGPQDSGECALPFTFLPWDADPEADGRKYTACPLALEAPPARASQYASELSAAGGRWCPIRNNLMRDGVYAVSGRYSSPNSKPATAAERANNWGICVCAQDQGGNPTPPSAEATPTASPSSSTSSTASSPPLAHNATATASPRTQQPTRHCALVLGGPVTPLTPSGQNRGSSCVLPFTYAAGGDGPIVAHECLAWSDEATRPTSPAPSLHSMSTLHETLKANSVTLGWCLTQGSEYATGEQAWGACVCGDAADIAKANELALAVTASPTRGTRRPTSSPSRSPTGSDDDDDEDDNDNDDDDDGSSYHDPRDSYEPPACHDIMFSNAPVRKGKCQIPFTYTYPADMRHVWGNRAGTTKTFTECINADDGFPIGADMFRTDRSMFWCPVEGTTDYDYNDDAVNQKWGMCGW